MASLRGETGSDGLRETVHRRLVSEGLLPGRLDQIRILTAKALLDRDSSTSDSEERNCSASPPSAGLRGCGCHGSVVLVGRLVAAIGDRPSSDYHALPSELAFCDSTAKIPCFVTSVSHALLDRDVVVVHWNFVKASPGRSFSPGYLEIGWVVPLSNDCEADRRPTALSAFTADDASFLQANRRVFGNRRLINVIGEVSAVSHPFRLAETTVGSVCLRDVETSRQVIVLNRDVKKLHWHPLLRLQRQYAFTDLEPTTLFPRDEKRTDVLQVTKGSKCYAAWEVSDCTAIVSVPDYLRSEGVDEELYVAWKRAAADALFAHPVNCSMFNFQGTITRDSWSDVGFFELDGSIRLHLGNVADVANFRHLRVGTQVTLYNVHVLKSHQVSTTTTTTERTIYCCCFGCVRVNKFSDRLPPPSSSSDQQSAVSDPDAEDLTPAVVRVSGNRKLAFVDFFVVLEAAKSFRRQFCPGLVPTFDEPLFLDVVSCRTPESNPPIERRSRRAIMEFVREDHGVGCEISSTAVRLSAFRLASVADVVGIFGTFASAARNGFRAGADESSYRNCRVISSEDLAPKWVITAVLQVGRSNARLQLVDQTGAVDCVVAGARNLSKDLGEMHQCTDDGCLEGPENRFPSGPTCPFPQTWSVGCLFRIGSFRVVREEFSQQQTGRRDASSSSSSAPLVYSYVEFSLNGALCLRRFDVLHPSFEWMSAVDRSNRRRPPKCGRPLSAAAADGSRCARVEDASCRGCGRGVCALNCPARRGDRARSATAEVSESSDRAADDCSCFVAQKFVLFHKGSVLASCSSLPSRFVLSFSLDAFLFDAACVFHCGCGRSSASKGPPPPPPPAASPSSGRHVSLVFQGRAVCWYPVLHAGCVYCLTVYRTADRKIFSANFGKPELRRFGAKQAIVLDRNVHLDRVSPLAGADRGGSGGGRCGTAAGRDPSDRLRVTDEELAAIMQVLQESRMKDGRRDGNMLVSLKGVVVFRGFREQHQQQQQSGDDPSTEAALRKMGVASFRNLSIQLLVRDLTSQKEHSVYVNTSRIQYPLGLFVGAVVNLERLEGRTSRAANRPYLQFLSTSSCTLIALASSDVDGEAEAAAHHTGGSSVAFRSASRAARGAPPPSFVYLRDLLRSSSASPHAVFVCCHIARIFRVTMEFSCVSHGPVRVDSSDGCARCQGPTRFRSVARFSVDDGTGVAYVNCHGDQVANLLTLNSAQWNRLKSMAGKTGGVSYFVKGGCDVESDSASSSSSPAETLVCLLCESNVVRRSVVLEAKRFRTFHNSTGARFANLDCFGLADFDKRVIKLKDCSSQETLRLPYLQLEYISMRDMDYDEVIASLKLRQ